MGGRYVPCRAGRAAHTAGRLSKEQTVTDTVVAEAWTTPEFDEYETAFEVTAYVSRLEK
jgi:coenzyme PQQ precursor peptide PqqA